MAQRSYCGTSFLPSCNPGGILFNYRHLLAGTSVLLGVVMLLLLWTENISPTEYNDNRRASKDVLMYYHQCYLYV